MYIYESVEIYPDYIDEQGYFNGIGRVVVNISLNETYGHQVLRAYYPLRYAWFRNHEGENVFYFYPVFLSFNLHKNN